MSQKKNAQKAKRRKGRQQGCHANAQGKPKTEERVRFERSRIAIGIVLGVLMVLSILMPLVYALM